ncbi:hypothetical protein VPH35_128993 [Triticum aestivum]
MEAASPCFNRSGGPPSVRSTSNHRQLAFFCAAVVHPLLPNPGAAPNPFYHMIPASPVGDGAVHRSWLIPPAPLRLRSRILHPSLKNVAPTFFHRASDSSAFLQLDMLLHRCSRGHPLHRQHPLSGQPAARGGLELQLEEVSTCRYVWLKSLNLTVNTWPSTNSWDYNYTCSHKLSSMVVSYFRRRSY